MPIYEFACSGCEHRFEVFGSYTARDQAQVCPRCESTSTRALFSTFATLGGSEEPVASSGGGGGGCGGCGGSCSCGN